MNIYDRIINILLEARVDMFIQDRLDEANLLDRGESANQKALNRSARQGGVPASFRRPKNVKRRHPKGTPSTRTTNTGKVVHRESPREKRREELRDAKGRVGTIPDAQRAYQIGTTGKPGVPLRPEDANYRKKQIKQAQAERQDKPKPQIP
jgi:hypothetical protein